jgi:predicted transcriptional regulator
MDIVTLSGIRKELLLYLDSGPHSLSEIRDRFDITSPEVSPRIKELIEHKLVKFENKMYHLTPMGKTIVSSFQPFVNTLNVFDQYPEFWESHDLTSIPEEFLLRIGEIKNYIIIEDDMEDINRTKVEGLDLIMQSKYLLGVSMLYDNDMPDLLIKLLDNNVKVSIIISKNVFNKLITDDFSFNKFKEYSNFSAYISDDNIRTAFTVNDFSLFFSLCYLNGKFDLHSNCISNEKSAINWGTDLFEYYKKNSQKII